MAHKISNQVMMKMYHCFFSMIRASLYVYHYSSVIDSSQRYIVSTGHRYSWYQQRKYSEDANGATCHHWGCSIDKSEREQENFLPVVGGYFLIIFLSATTGIPEGVVTLKESPPSLRIFNGTALYVWVCLCEAICWL